MYVSYYYIYDILNLTGKARTPKVTMNKLCGKSKWYDNISVIQVKILLKKPSYLL